MVKNNVAKKALIKTIENKFKEPVEKKKIIPDIAM